VSVRGIVTEALREGWYWIVLEYLKCSIPVVLRVALKDVCSWTETPLIAVARSLTWRMSGSCLPMFFEHSEKYQLRNFDPKTARQFALETAQQMQLQAANREDVIEKIVRYSKGNPEAIRTMIQMAASQVCGPKARKALATLHRFPPQMGWLLMDEGLSETIGESWEAAC